MTVFYRWIILLAILQANIFNFGTSKPFHGHHLSHKRMKHNRVKAIKQEILNKLGMAHVPKVNKFNVTVEHKRKMMKLYKKSLAENRDKVHTLYSEDDYLAKTYHNFKDTGSSPPAVQTDPWSGSIPEGDGHLRVYFPVDIPQPGDHRKEIYVHTAKLKLYKFHTRASSRAAGASSVDGDKIRVNIYQLLEPGATGGSQSVMKRLLDSRLVSMREMEWETFDVRAAVAEWVESPATNYGLEISTDSGRLSDFVQFVSARTSAFRDFADNDSVMEDLLPELSLYTQDRPILGRQKRSLSDQKDCTQGDGETRCCRYPLWVDFSTIGWDEWILSPEGYQAYYCDGQCPHRYKVAHNFAGIKSLLHYFNPDASPAPCCMATKLAPLSLLHFNELGEIVVSIYEDMIVEECKCA